MNLNPIVLDLETSGLDKLNSGIWQIGALDFNTGENFLEEAKLDAEDVVEEAALKIIGKTEAELRDTKKQSQQQLIENFFNWMSRRPLSNLLCQNPQFDLTMLELKAKKYGISQVFHYRSFDLHTIAQTIYHKINGEYLTENGHSNMSLPKISEFCGIVDERVALEGGEVIKEGVPHNALDDVKLTAECFSRLMFGKSLFPEYVESKVPKYLEK
jgi:DNA polymerase III epsilon subunit-like protein